jgi:acyl-CoA reductase-like NAD-dependent aldehyde dehydrogenase
MLLSSLFPKYLDSQCFKIINGGKETVQSLLESAFGHILFTGGTEIGERDHESGCEASDTRDPRAWG